MIKNRLEKMKIKRQSRKLQLEIEELERRRDEAYDRQVQKMQQTAQLLLHQQQNFSNEEQQQQQQQRSECAANTEEQDCCCCCCCCCCYGCDLSVKYEDENLANENLENSSAAQRQLQFVDDYTFAGHKLAEDEQQQPVYNNFYYYATS